jgi:hypothetical protein
MSNNKRVIWKYILTFSFAGSQIVGTNPPSSQLFQGVSLRYWTYLEDQLTLHVTGKFQVVTTGESSGNISLKDPITSFPSSCLETCLDLSLS